MSDEIYTAIARHDVAGLSGMAEQAQSEETRMFLTLLADIVDDDTVKKGRPRRSCRPHRVSRRGTSAPDR